jgi:hypothetical protein
MGLYEVDRSGSGWGSVEGSCEHGNEPSGSIKRGFSRRAQLHDVAFSLIREMIHHYEDQSVIAVKELMSLYYKHPTKQINTSAVKVQRFQCQNSWYKY